jgi:hypothetical protein
MIFMVLYLCSLGLHFFTFFSKGRPKENFFFKIKYSSIDAFRRVLNMITYLIDIETIPGGVC